MLPNTKINSVSSVAQLCLTLCDPMDCGTPGFPVHLQLLELAQTHVHQTKLITWITALSNSMKLWAMLCRATQDGRVMVESSNNMWPTGEGSGKPLLYSCLENPMNSRKHWDAFRNIWGSMGKDKRLVCERASRGQDINFNVKREINDYSWFEHVKQVKGDMILWWNKNFF